MTRAVSEVRAVVRWLQPRSTAIAVSGVSMGSPVAALVSHLETVDGRGLYPDLRAQRDDRSAPRPVGPVGPRRRRCTAIGDCRAVGVTGRSAGCRADAAA